MKTEVSQFLVLLGRTSVEAGILVVLVLAAGWVFRGQLTPRWRCALWWLVAARLLLPFSFSSAVSVFNLLPRAAQLGFGRPVQTMPVAPAMMEKNATRVPMPSISKENSTQSGLKPGLQAVPTLSPTKSRPAWSWPICIFTVWLAGVLALAGHVAASSFRFRRRCAPLSPAAQIWTAALLEQCCQRLQLRNAPAVLESIEVSSPALHGLFRPRLLLPKGFTEKFSVAELRFVFLHELAHLKRRDLLMNWLVVVLQILHWFNPLVWFGFARWRAERELACDAMALEAAGEGQNKEYGRTILHLLDSFGQPTTAPGLVGILEDKRQLRRRIAMIASYAPGRGWPRLAVVLIGLLAVIGLTDASTTTSQQQKGNDMNHSIITNQLVSTAAAGLLALAPATTPIAAHGEDAPASPAVSDSAKQLIGAWVLVGTPDHVGKAPSAGGRLHFFTGAYWCNTQADPKTGVVLFHHGGTYTVNGDTFHANLDFANSSTMNLIGRTNGNFTCKVEGDTLTKIGIDNPWKEVWKRLKPQGSLSSPLAQSLTGTWAYLGKPGETNAVPQTNRLKFCAGGYWCDTEMDQKTGVVVVHHGGYYSLKGDKYVETCQYANPTTMDLIGEEVKFNIKIEGDRLTLTGINNPWNEVWKRLD